LIFQHDENTFRQRPNVTINNIYCIGGNSYVADNSRQHYETVVGYSRNHLNHKMIFLTNEAKPIVNVVNNFGMGYERYIKSRQTSDTTIDSISGITDNSLPVQTANVSNINVISTTNVLS